MNANPRQIAVAVAWLAALGLLVIVATRLVGQVTARAAGKL